ncbi:MAG: redoxin domain-containing protein [Bacteroidota bacterium]
MRVISTQIPTTGLRYSLLILLLSVFCLVQLNAQSENHKPNIAPSEFTAKSGAVGWQEGLTAPDLQFNDINGKKANLYDMLDKPVVLEFWSLDCQQCLKNKTYLKSFYKQFDIHIVSICPDEYPNEIRKLAKSKQLTWMNIYDDSKKFNGSDFASTNQLGNASFVLITPDKKVNKVFTSDKDFGKLGVALQQYFGKR